MAVNLNINFDDEEEIVFSSDEELQELEESFYDYDDDFDHDYNDSYEDLLI